MLPVSIREWMTNKAFTVSCSYSAFIFVRCVCVCVLKVVLCSISVVVFSIMASPVWTFGISPASSLTVREVKGWNGMLLCIFSRTMKHLGLGCLGIMNEKSIWNNFFFSSQFRCIDHIQATQVWIYKYFNDCMKVCHL